ncbi:MAG: nuclear transport factor 2 family protein [Gemmatimonadales bacterium]|nr:nuclear transport factor 2 family protein [Gemmatimonadales bacterium]
MSDSPAATASTAELGRRLIDEFGAGWSNGDIRRLLACFHPDAVFIETPFSEPSRGLEAIRQYWAETPYYQAEVTFTSGEVFTIGPWFATEFKCTYRRRRTGEWVDARGAMFCESDGALITEMRLYWHRWSGGRELLDR